MMLDESKENKSVAATYFILWVYFTLCISRVRQVHSFTAAQNPLHMMKSML